MRLWSWVGCGVLVLCLAARDGSTPTASPASSSPPTSPGSAPPVKSAAPAVAARDGQIEVIGRTQCTPGRRASIAPVPLHPVVEVKVVPGERVTKGQLLVKLDDDEARADVRLKKALLESAQYSANEARRFLAKAVAKQAVLPEQRLHDAELAVRKAEADQRAAQAALDSSEAELEHFSVGAVIDGIVSRLEVYPGLVSRPGTAIWGEIVDLRELDVHCDLTPEQADELAVGREVEVRTTAGEHSLSGAHVVFIGPVADSKNGLIPVLVRVRNADERLRCGVPVTVRFSDCAALCKK